MKPVPPAFVAALPRLIALADRVPTPEEVAAAAWLVEQPRTTRQSPLPLGQACAGAAEKEPA